MFERAKVTLPRHSKIVDFFAFPELPKSRQKFLSEPLLKSEHNHQILETGNIFTSIPHHHVLI